MFYPCLQEHLKKYFPFITINWWQYVMNFFFVQDSSDIHLEWFVKVGNGYSLFLVYTPHWLLHSNWNLMKANPQSFIDLPDRASSRYFDRNLNYLTILHVCYAVYLQPCFRDNFDKENVGQWHDTQISKWFSWTA